MSAVPARELKREIESLRGKMAENERLLGELHLRIEDLEGASDAAMRTLESSKAARKQRQNRKR